MQNKLSHFLAAALVKAGADKTKEAIYAYGIECILSTAIILLLLAIAGIVLGKPLNMLIFVLSWLPLRIFVGGAHAKSHTMCTIVSVGLGICALLLNELLCKLPPVAVIAAAILSFVIFVITAPVVWKTHPISKAHRQKMRRNAIIFSAIECIAIIVLACFSSVLMGVILFSYTSTAVMAVVGYASRDSIKVFE